MLTKGYTLPDVQAYLPLGTTVGHPIAPSVEGKIVAYDDAKYIIWVKIDWGNGMSFLPAHDVVKK